MSNVVKIIGWRRVFMPLAAVMLAGAAVYASQTPVSIDFGKVNSQALKEYDCAIRPGYEGRNPYWNEFATKFTYAPAFGFGTVDGATRYRYTVAPDTAANAAAATVYERVENPGFAPVSFEADTPGASLSPIWGRIPPAYVTLTVEALDGDGRVLATVGTRRFLRDYGFCGPYSGAVRPYREAAVRGMLFIHNMPQVKSWLTSDTPDMSYTLYAYANKIISAVIRNEVLVARYLPSERDEALRIAESAARFLISQSQGADAALPYFPPTYYGGVMASAMEENRGATMTMDATYAIQAMLDLFDVTGRKEYYDRALAMTRTYRAIQRADGSWPIKVYYLTGKPTNETSAMLHAICFVAERFRSQYGVGEFAEMQRKAERWMHDDAIRRFDMTAQFEDVSVNSLRPYENLTNYVAANYARYLTAKEAPTADDLRDARDLMQFSEDQFVHWDYLPNPLGYSRYNTPCVVEQYKFRTPVDNSAANVAGAFMGYYRATGDLLAYAKAKALVDNMTIQQNQQTGYLPTYWDCRNEYVEELSMWANCAYTVIERLLEFDAMQQ